MEVPRMSLLGSPSDGCACNLPQPGGLPQDMCVLLSQRQPDVQWRVPGGRCQCLAFAYCWSQCLDLQLLASAVPAALRVAARLHRSARLPLNCSLHHICCDSSVPNFTLLNLADYTASSGTAYCVVQPD